MGAPSARPAGLRRRAALLVAVTLAAVAGPLEAQTLYRSVDANGRVTYTDQPPPAPGARTRAVDAAPTAAPPATLPFALRSVAERYPVTLYARAEACVPCDDGRRWLQQRGIPYTEKRVATEADRAAFLERTRQDELPALTIGPQLVTGYSPTRWAELFDAAGYPRSSQLPANWRTPAPTPLVNPPAETPAAPPDGTPTGVPNVPPPPPASTADNPAGIRF